MRSIVRRRFVGGLLPWRPPAAEIRKERVMSPRQNPAAELAIQRRYLDSLGSDVDHPIFNARHAIKSQRASGYRNTARAAREIVDN